VPAMSDGRSQRRVYLSFERGETGALAERLIADLTTRGFEVAGPTKGVRPLAAIAASDAVLVILSPAVIRSDERLEEIACARRGDVPRPVVPVMAVECEVPVVIVRLQWVDMQGWDESALRYEAGLQELVRSIDAVVEG